MFICNHKQEKQSFTFKILRYLWLPHIFRPLPRADTDTEKSQQKVRNIFSEADFLKLPEHFLYTWKMGENLHPYISTEDKLQCELRVLLQKALHPNTGLLTYASKINHFYKSN